MAEGMEQRTKRIERIQKRESHTGEAEVREEMEHCIFCRIVHGEVPSRKIYEDADTLAFMDVAGDVDGHMLVIPKKHVKNVLDCDEDTYAQVMGTVQKVAKHLVTDCGYDGVNLLNANEEAAGQSVPHLHIHIIPRSKGDGVDAWPKFTGAVQELDAVYLRCLGERKEAL